MNTTHHVICRFYKMLIYEPGDFFIEHVDSQYTTDQFGTLSINVPFAHQGGLLTIAGTKIDFSSPLLAPSNTTTASSSITTLNYAAWLNNVVHKVDPVTSGYRIVLVYLLYRNLTVSHTDLATDTTEYFSKLMWDLVLTDWKKQSYDNPGGLAILLKHQYSISSLYNTTADGVWQPLLRGKDALIFQMIHNMPLKHSLHLIIEVKKIDDYSIINDYAEFQMTDCWVSDSLKFYGNSDEHPKRPNELSTYVLFLRSNREAISYDDYHAFHGHDGVQLRHVYYGNGECGNGMCIVAFFMV